jgi:protein gp37
MADGSSIQWTDATWNPIRGCSKVSEGCRYCYAMGVAARFAGPGLPYEGLGKMTSAGPAWTGKVRTVPAHLDDPLRWSRPRRIFVNSMSDLFHEALAIETIGQVFAVMYLAPRHTFQVLTKRAERMHQVLTHPDFYRLVLGAADRLRDALPRQTGKHTATVGISDPTKSPAPWVQLGVSVENREAEARIAYLRATPSVVRFLSCEPLIERIEPNLTNIDWVIVGGESGHHARPFDLDWAFSLQKQCAETGAAFFMKQLGANAFVGESQPESSRGPWKTNDGHGGDIAEFPQALQVRQFPEVRRG